MRNVYERQVAEQRNIERQIRQGTDKIVSRKFGRVAKFLWPFKTRQNVWKARNAVEDRREADPKVAAAIAELSGAWSGA